MTEIGGHNLAICGHSFMTRLNTACHKSQSFSPNLNLVDTSVTWHTGFGTWDKFRDRPHGLPALLSPPHPDIVYFELGGNDLDSHLSAVCVAKKALDTASVLIKQGVSLVILGQALHRGKTREVPVHQYNAKVDAYNRALQDTLEHPDVNSRSSDRFADSTRWYWKHLKMQEFFGDMLDPEDLVHLTDHGNKKLYRSIRAAMIQGIRSIN